MALTVMTVIRVSQETWLADMPKWDGIVAVYTAVTAAIDIIGHSDSHPACLVSNLARHRRTPYYTGAESAD